MKLIFGLGNPGSDYAGTRHNTGFIVLDALAKETGISFSERPKFSAYVAELPRQDDKVLLVKPTTYYNNVGASARSLIDFYKLSAAHDILVIHDDLALPLGTLRIRRKGSDAGNNGIKSLSSHLGDAYARLRIGIARTPRTNDDASYVLSRFSEAERKIVKEAIIPKSHELIRDFIRDELEETSFTVR
jgi:PTH1 family peptidyl-tRNA hydrolase